MPFASAAQPVAPSSRLLEVVTPRVNDATITPMENLLAALSLTEHFALEIAATAAGRRFLVRAASDAMREHLADQLAVAYPQATLRALPLPEGGGTTGADGNVGGPVGDAVDPAAHGAGERVVATTLILRDPPYLPLRPFPDVAVDDERSAQADPILGLLGALGRLPPGWRVLSQLVIAPAPEGWARPYRRLALERPLAADYTADRGTGGGSSTNAQLFLLALAALALAAWQAHAWYEAGAWGSLGLLGAGLGGLAALAWAARGLFRAPVYDPRLVREKIARPARIVEIRLAVFAPVDAPEARMRARLDQLATAYHQFTHDEGNGLVARRLRGACPDLRGLAPVSPRRTLPLLNTREVAALWHLPQSGADVALVERAGPRQIAPPPGAVARGCPIGRSAQQGHAVPVALPDDTLDRNLLLVAKTRRGKSSLLLRLARRAMTPPPDGPARALVLVDPHSDLARAALGVVPPDRHDDVVFLDVARADRPFGLNLLDAGLGWDRDQAVANTLKIFNREFDGFWGPRMADCFRWGALTLYEANAAYCAADPWRGRDRQHTILELPQLFVDLAFRRPLLELVRDPGIRHWWEDFFDSALDRRLQLESSNPVSTKINTYAGSRAARAVVGQPRSTIDPAAWVREGRIVVVDGAKGRVGEHTAALIGGTLLNLVDLALGAQAALPPGERRRATLVVDEFHTMPGADYESLLAEQAKYGANVYLATQSLARLDARDPARALRAIVFANLDGLFAFHCSAEDAEYLLPELGPPVTVEDLTGLGEHRCYARLSGGGERLPPFLVHLDPPPPADPALAAALAAASAERYGRPRAAVEAAYVASLERIAATHRVAAPTIVVARSGSGLPLDPLAPRAGATRPAHGQQPRGKKRNEQRQGRADGPPRQAPLPQADAPNVGDGERAAGGAGIVTEQGEGER
jgi:hypothetical protein